MSDADARTERPQQSAAFNLKPTLLACLSILIFTVGSIAYFVSNLPLPIPSNASSFLLSLLHSGIFSSQSLILLYGLIYVGRIVEPPSAIPEIKRPIFPSWLLKRPFNGIALGIFIFSLPLLVIIGLLGIAYLLGAGLFLYNTPRLLAKGPPGIAAFLMSSLIGGGMLAALLPISFTVDECKPETNFLLRSGETLPCSEFMYVGDANAFVISHNQSSVFVPLADLTSESRDKLSMVHRSLRSEFNLFD